MNENNSQDNWVSGSDQNSAPVANAPEQGAPSQNESQAQQQISSQAQVYNPAPQQNQAAPVPTQDDNKKANTLCIISLVCHYAPALGLGSVASALQESSNEALSTTGDVLSAVISLAMFGAWIASWVLMIVVRVKYKSSTFGKVLMWIYIISAILGVLAIIAIIAFFAAAFAACAGMGDAGTSSFQSLT